MKMTRSHWRGLAMVNANFATVTLGSLVVPVFLGEFDIAQWPVVVLGMIATALLTWLTLFSAEKGKL